jgi:hypothetical protein
MKVIKHKDKWYLQSDTGYKEILLSTDDLLIKDGVQAITDEFLEWFFKNPSCEEVEVESNKCLVKRGQCSCSYQDIDCQCSDYQIIIPKEEPKQETAEEAAVINYKELYQGEPLTQEVPIDAFIEGAKWQQEQYEILFDEYHEYTVDCIEVELKRPLPLQKWFKQFKKK